MESNAIGLNLKDVGMRDCSVDISNMEVDVLITPACVQKQINVLASHDQMNGRCLEDDRNFQYFTYSDGPASDLLIQPRSIRVIYKFWWLGKRHSVQKWHARAGISIEGWFNSDFLCLFWKTDNFAENLKESRQR